MHSPSETIQLSDVSDTAELIARFCRSLRPDQEWIIRLRRRRTGARGGQALPAPCSRPPTARSPRSSTPRSAAHPELDRVPGLGGLLRRPDLSPRRPRLRAAGRLPHGTGTGNPGYEVVGKPPRDYRYKARRLRDGQDRARSGRGVRLAVLRHLRSLRRAAPAGVRDPGPRGRRGLAADDPTIDALGRGDGPPSEPVTITSAPDLEEVRVNRAAAALAAAGLALAVAGLRRLQRRRTRRRPPRPRQRAPPPAAHRAHGDEPPPDRQAVTPGRPRSRASRSPTRC